MTLDLERLRSIAAGCPGGRLVVVFGSAVTGRAAPWSDLDIGVSGAPYWQGLEIGASLGQSAGREPHVVDLDHASDWLRFEVARDGVLLHEREPGAWARFRAEAALRWFDVAPIVALCADGARRHLAGKGAPHG